MFFVKRGQFALNSRLIGLRCNRLPLIIQFPFPKLVKETIEMGILETAYIAICIKLTLGGFGSDIDLPSVERQHVAKFMYEGIVHRFKILVISQVDFERPGL